MKFMHIADIHLGYQQYGLQERFDDFSHAYLRLLDEALAQQVDFVLLAGDLFEKRTVDPLAMRVAIEGFSKLQQAGIPVLAVEGNHEKAYYHEQYSWMDFLDGLGCVTLLNPRFEDGRAILEPYSDDGGAYVDLPGGVRVYGIKYYGASTGKVLSMFSSALATLDHSQVRYAILMLHAGLEGQLAHIGRLKLSDLEPLREHIDYVALGHIHKPYSVEDWIYNPGSPENNSMDETNWPKRGYYLVEIRPGQEPPHHAELGRSSRRLFRRYPLEVHALESPHAVYDAVRDLTVRHAGEVKSSAAPVVELRLKGVLPFNRYALDLSHVQALVDDAWAPLVTRVRNQTTPVEFDMDADEPASRPELERVIVRDLLARDARYRDAAESWAEGALALKQQVLAGDEADLIIEHLRQLLARPDLSAPEV